MIRTPFEADVMHFRTTADACWFQDITELTSSEIRDYAAAIEQAIAIGQTLWWRPDGSHDFGLCEVRERVNTLLYLQQQINEFSIDPIAFYGK